MIAPMAHSASVPPSYHQRDLRGSDGGSPGSILCAVGMGMLVADLSSSS